MALKNIVDEHLIITVEKAIAGGYIATVGESTGNERQTVNFAIRHALQLEMRRLAG
jgi:hypothetical protein